MSNGFKQHFMREPITSRQFCEEDSEILLGMT